MDEVGATNLRHHTHSFHVFDHAGQGSRTLQLGPNRARLASAMAYRRARRVARACTCKAVGMDDWDGAAAAAVQRTGRTIFPGVEDVLWL